MATVRANQMIENGLYVMRTFRRTSGSNYLYDLVRFVSRTSSAKLNELKPEDNYYVIIGEVPVKLTPYNGILSRCLDGRQFRVTFQTEDTAMALGLDTGPAGMFKGTPLTIEEAAEQLSTTFQSLADMPSHEEQMKRSKELRAERAENAKAARGNRGSLLDGTPMADLPCELPSESAAKYGLKLEGDEFVACDDPVEPIEPVIPPEPVEPVIPPSSDEEFAAKAS